MLIILRDIFVCVINFESKKVMLIHCLFILNYLVLVTETQDYVIVIVYVHIVQGIGCVTLKYSFSTFVVTIYALGVTSISLVWN